MSNNVISDNWSLQDLSMLFGQGLNLDSIDRINIYKNENKFKWEKIPHYFIQIKLLIDLLNDIVIRENIIVDHEFINAWNSNESLMALNRDQIIKPLIYNKNNSEVSQLRKIILQQICVTTDMQNLQKECENSWKLYKKQKHKYFSQLVWGTAGIISSTSNFNYQYNPYPLRADLLSQTMYSNSKKDLVDEIITWIKNENTKIYQVNTPSIVTSCARLIISPFATEIIDTSKDLSDIIKNAIRFRNQYSKIRKWISEYNEAIENENIKEMNKKKKILNDVSNEMSKYSSANKFGETKIYLNFSLLNPSAKIEKKLSLSKIYNKYGIRNSFSKLILNTKGESTLKKLLKIFEYRNCNQFSELVEFLKN